MYYSRKYIFLLLSIVLISNTFTLPCKAIESDLGLWTRTRIDIPITKKIDGRIYASPRWLDNSTDFNQFILHSLLGYKLNKNFSIWQGYAWSTTYIPTFRREQRLYNDLVLESNYKKLKIENRVRFEERFLQDIEGLSLRSRYRLKGSYPLDKKGNWSAVLFDEIFFNCNSHNSGPQAGLDQNRIYLGLNRKINEHFNIDGGYQLQHSHKKGADNDILNHFILINLNLTLPQLIK